MYVDWTADPPFTPDLTYHGKLRSGSPNHVYLDGVEQFYVTRMWVDPKNGWVEQYRKDEAGVFLENSRGELARFVTWGSVLYAQDRTEEPVPEGRALAERGT